MGDLHAIPGLGDQAAAGICIEHGPGSGWLAAVAQQVAAAGGTPDILAAVADLDQVQEHGARGLLAG